MISSWAAATAVFGASFLAMRSALVPGPLGGRCVRARALLQHVDQRRGDVRAGVTLLDQPLDHLVIGPELLFLQRGAEFLEKHIALGLLDLVQRRHPLAADLEPAIMDHVLHLVELAAGHEREGHALLARAARAADAVRVILGVVRQVEVEHYLEVVHVEPARGDVGRDEELEAAPPELVHHARALRLRDVAVQAVRRVAAGMQVVVEFVDHDLGAAER